MRTLNYIFSDHESLVDFIISHDLKNGHTLMIQCFDGVLDIEFTQSILELLKFHLPCATIIGTSTNGEIAGGSLLSKKFVLSFSIFEETTITSKVISLKNKSFNVGDMIGQKALSVNAKALIMFAAPLNSDGDELMEGIRSVNSDVIVGGGMSGDNGLLKFTYVIHGFEIYIDSCVTVFLSSENLHVSSMSSFNWIPISREFTVTQSEGNHLYKVDDISIIQAYREYFGDEAVDNLPYIGAAFPIIVNMNATQVGRVPIALLENEGLLYEGKIPEGAKIRFAVGNTQLMLEASYKLQKDLMELGVQSIFIYSCMVRKRFLGLDADMEIKPLNTVAPVSGFFTYGEFFTDPSSGKCSLLNETMSILAMYEEKGVCKSKQLESNDNFVSDFSLVTFKALTHVINKTSLEFEKLNKSLQERVKEEISKNRDKDKMMLTQSKQATMGEMMSMIAHQWRQPIATIGLICDNLSLDVAMDEIVPDKILESTELINKQVHYLSSTIDDFSSYFRPDNVKKTFTIGSFFQEISQILGKSLEHKRIELRGDFDKNEQIYTFKQELAQICINIINNAKDALLEHQIVDGFIEFCYKHVDNQHQIRIKDNAGGISSEIAEKIFEPYFSTKDEKHGTGLGLYISKIIAQQNLGGDLIHYNEGNGSVFFISFDVVNDTN